MKKRIVALASHGSLAQGMLDACTLIQGERDDLVAAAPYSGDTAALTRFVNELLDRVGEDGHLILVTDLFGGSVNNTLAAFVTDPRVTVVTGMNLALVLEIVASGATGVDDRVIDAARNALVPVRPAPVAATEDF